MIQQLKTRPANAKEIAAVMERRHKEAAISIKDHYVDGSEYLATHLEKIVEELTNSTEIVQPEKEANFKSQIEDFLEKSSNNLSVFKKLDKIKSSNPVCKRCSSPTASQFTINSAPESVTPSVNADTLKRKSTKSEYNPSRQG